MKYLAVSLGLLSPFFSIHSYADQSYAGSTVVDTQQIEQYLKTANEKKLAQNIIWQRLLYAEDSLSKNQIKNNNISKVQNSKQINQSEVSYSGYFLA